MINNKCTRQESTNHYICLDDNIMHLVWVSNGKGKKTSSGGGSNNKSSNRLIYIEQNHNRSISKARPIVNHFDLVPKKYTMLIWSHLNPQKCLRLSPRHLKPQPSFGTVPSWSRHFENNNHQEKFQLNSKLICAYIYDFYCFFGKHMPWLSSCIPQ